MFEKNDAQHIEYDPDEVVGVNVDCIEKNTSDIAVNIDSIDTSVASIETDMSDMALDIESIKDNIQVADCAFHSVCLMMKG